MLKKTKVAINGFGRIGRAVFKIILEKHPNLDIVAINDLTDPKSLANLLKHDTAYGIYDKEVGIKDGKLMIGKKGIIVLNDKEPTNLPWKDLGVELVIECTGFFRTKDEASRHLKAGAKKVVISAPSKGDKKIKTIVLGVNEKKLTKTDNIISCASCTTNCLAPVTEIIRENFGIQKALMSTIHGYTADQNLVDGPHKDPRRGRAAAQNIVPTTTGAAKATIETIPSLKNKFNGIAVRVPILVGSLIDATYVLKKKTNLDKVHNVFKKAARSAQYKGILETTEEPLVSTDIIKTSASSIVDFGFTQIIDGDLLKIVAWYDNEWGYSNRLADLSSLLAQKYL